MSTPFPIIFFPSLSPTSIDFFQRHLSWMGTLPSRATGRGWPGSGWRRRMSSVGGVSSTTSGSSQPLTVWKSEYSTGYIQPSSLHQDTLTCASWSYESNIWCFWNGIYICYQLFMRYIDFATLLFIKQNFKGILYNAPFIATWQCLRPLSVLRLICQILWHQTEYCSLDQLCDIIPWTAPTFVQNDFWSILIMMDVLLVLANVLKHPDLGSEFQRCDPKSILIINSSVRWECVLHIYIYLLTYQYIYFVLPIYQSGPT